MHKLIEKIREYVAYLKLVIQHGRAYRKALHLTTFLVTATLVLSLVFLLPRADKESIQAGLTVIAETLGVLLGLVFVVVVLLIEQGRQAEDTLIAVSPKYRDWALKSCDEIDSERRALIASVKGGEVRLDELQSQYDPTTTQEIICNLSNLIVALCPEKFQEVWKDLWDLGCAEEASEWGKIANPLGDVMRPGEFLRFLRSTLNQMDDSSLRSDAMRTLVLHLNAEYIRDGIPTAWRRFGKLRSVLGSRIFVASVSVLTLTTVLAVMTIFGITDQTTVYEPVYGWLVVAVISGFVLSVILTLRLVDRMLM
jgi:hypothetical protein